MRSVWQGISAAGHALPASGGNMNLFRLRLARNVALAGSLVFAASCNDTTGTNYATGVLTVTVTDTDNALVSGVGLNLMLPDKATTWRLAVTGSDGKATFGTEDGGMVLVQDYLVFFPPQTQWILAPGETNYKPVTAVKNQTVNVNFKVQKVVINPG
jgi:hypothetical protein